MRSTIRVACDMTEEQALHLAQFLKRSGFDDFRDKACTQAEAYAMRDAASLMEQALRRVLDAN